MQAKIMDTSSQASQDGQYLSFTLGGDVYGVDILRVQEIRGWEEVRHLPQSAEYVKGVLDLRGVIVPIIDLRIRFGLEEVEYTPTTVVIVVALKSRDGKAYLVGIVVDGVSDVLDVAGGEIKPAPRMGGVISSEYLAGMVSLKDRMVILLQIDNLYSDEELVEIGEIQG